MNRPAGQILSSRLILSIFVPASVVGALSLLFGVAAVIEGAAKHVGSWVALLGGALVYAAGWRRRVVWLDPGSGLLTITWGRRWPLARRRHLPQDWITFKVRTFSPAFNPDLGPGARQDLRDLSELRGRTRDYRDVSILASVSDAKVRELRDSLERRGGIARAPFRYEARALRGERGWTEEPFFVAHGDARQLYLRLVDATPAEPVDVVALASALRIGRPWAEVARLEREGWLTSPRIAARATAPRDRAERAVAERLRGGATEAKLLAALEETLGWADPDVLAHVLAQLDRR